MMEIKQNFVIEIKKELYDKIQWLVNNYEKEISAWLIGEMTEDKIFIEDFLIPFQEVGSASVDTSGKSLVKLRKEYGDKCKKIIGHWHSHNTMSAFWSDVDDDFIKEFIAPREKAIFIVSSQREGHRIRLEINKPIKLSLDELDYKVFSEKNEELEKELKSEISKKVEEKAITTSYKNNGWINDYSDTDYSYNKLTKEQIKRMVYFDSKTNNVYVKSLTLDQYWKIEDVFPIETEVHRLNNDSVTIQYLTKKKDKAINLIKDLKDFLEEEFLEKEILDRDEQEEFNDYNKFEENYYKRGYFGY